jgi:hypothetical protein
MLQANALQHFQVIQKQWFFSEPKLWYNLLIHFVFIDTDWFRGKAHEKV